MDYNMRILNAIEVINEAEYILIGAGAGLSDAAGIKFSGSRFTNNFGDYIKKYGMTDLYTSSFYPFKSQEEKWAYWAKHISLNRYETKATQLYSDLFDCIKNKQYFVITTNVDHQFMLTGVPNDKLFATQGDYGYLQCEIGCHDKRYDNEILIKEMISQTKDCRIPSKLVPKCPICHGNMEVNLRKDNHFVQDDAWYSAKNNYEQFLKDSSGHKLVLIELGVGYNTPGIIRYPFEQYTFQSDNAHLIRINRDFPFGVKENKHKTISFDEEMNEVITQIRKVILK